MTQITTGELQKHLFSTYSRRRIGMIMIASLFPFFSSGRSAVGWQVAQKLPEHWYRRLAAEYLQERWGDIEIMHLV